MVFIKWLREVVVKEEEEKEDNAFTVPPSVIDSSLTRYLLRFQLFCNANILF